MDVDCRRPRHDENYSSLFVENSHPETLHRDMCIACSGSSWILWQPYVTSHAIEEEERKPVAYTVVEKSDIPEELSRIMEEKKEKEFQLILLELL